MAGTGVVHQIEYRWDPVKDVSPVASSLAGEATRGFDVQIRPWVRHPNVDAPPESVCYQALQAGTAALAWRYLSWPAAERGDGAPGRPLVSRVLVGPADLLSAEVAIALCRAGLPAAAGPRPGDVTAGTALPPIEAAELTGLVSQEAAELDQLAAREKGLPQVVGAALADPDIPLAVQLGDLDICCPPRDGAQSLLLWGLLRIVWPLLGGAARRGWSFSTFELPMGDSDTTTLPDIVFRAAPVTSAAPPVNARREARVRLGDPGPATVTGGYPAELAEWLVAEYQETGGGQLRDLLAGQETGQPVGSRLAAVHDLLRAKRSPVLVSGPEVRLAPAPPPRAPGPAAVGEPAPAAAIEPAAASEPAPVSPPDGPAMLTIPADPVTDPGTGTTRRPTDAPRLGVHDQRMARYDAEPRSVPALLTRLECEQDGQEVRSVLRQLASATAGTNDRGIARRQLPKSGWCITALERHGDHDVVACLAGVFRIVVLPDLKKPSVARALGDWVRQAPPQVTAALLAAAKAADRTGPPGDGTFRLMTGTLGEAGLQRLLEVSGITFDWPQLPGERSRTGILPAAAALPGKLLRWLGLIHP